MIVRGQTHYFKNPRELNDTQCGESVIHNFLSNCLVQSFIIYTLIYRIKCSFEVNWICHLHSLGTVLCLVYSLRGMRLDENEKHEARSMKGEEGMKGRVFRRKLSDDGKAEKKVGRYATTSLRFCRCPFYPWDLYSETNWMRTFSRLGQIDRRWKQRGTFESQLS